MDTYFKAIKFILSHNEELSQKYNAIKSSLPKQFLQDVKNSTSSFKQINETALVELGNYAKFFVFRGRDRAHDREFSFSINNKTLSALTSTLNDGEEAEFGMAVVEEEDKSFVYYIKLAKENDTYYLVTDRTVRSRENYNLCYEPDSTEKLSVSAEELSAISAPNINLN